MSDISTTTCYQANVRELKLALHLADTTCAYVVTTNTYVTTSVCGYTSLVMSKSLVKSQLG